MRWPNGCSKAGITVRPKVQDDNLSLIGAPVPGWVIGITSVPGKKLVTGGNDNQMKSIS